MLRSYLVLSAVVFLVAGGVSFVLAYTRKMAALANPSGTVSRETYVVAANGSARAISAPVVRGFASYLSGGTFLVWGAMLMLVGLMILAADIRWSYPRPSSGGPLLQLRLFDQPDPAFAARETQDVPMRLNCPGDPAGILQVVDPVLVRRNRCSLPSLARFARS
jgi:hypothetical protein